MNTINPQVMSSQNIFGLECQVGKQRYLLTKTELRCSGGPEKNNFSLPLNQISTHYSYGGSYSLQTLMFLVVLLFVVAARSLQWLMNSPLFNDLAIFQLILFSIGFIAASYRLYQQWVAKHTYHFNLLRDGTSAFSVFAPKKEKEKIQSFINTLILRIQQTTPCNDHTLHLLNQYNLLAYAEYVQLDANVSQNQPIIHSTENVVPLLV